MKPILKKTTVALILVLGLFVLAGCGERIPREEVEKMKIKQTVGNYLDGFTHNNSERIMQTLNMSDENQEEVRAVLDQFLTILHKGPFKYKVSYEIQDADIDTRDKEAEIDISAVLRVFDEEEVELVSVRLFKDRELDLIQDENGEWKIDAKQFIPRELLRLDLLF